MDWGVRLIHGGPAAPSFFLYYLWFATIILFSLIYPVKVCQHMTNSYNLDDLRTDLEREFAPLQLEIGNKTVTLKNLMRLSRDDRAKVVTELEIIQSTNTENAEGIDTVLASVKHVLGIVAGEADAKTLNNAIGDDLALAMKIMRLWSEATQTGEAQNSPA